MNACATYTISLSGPSFDVMGIIAFLAEQIDDQNCFDDFNLKNRFCDNDEDDDDDYDFTLLQREEHIEIYETHARYVIESLVKRGYIDLVCNKATIPHFTKDKLSNAPLPVLPEDEQTAIISYLDTQCAQIDALIALKQQKADKLVQYKKSLIYEVVTGKREV